MGPRDDFDFMASYTILMWCEQQSEWMNEQERERERKWNVNKGANRWAKRAIGASTRTHAHKWMLYRPTHYHHHYSCLCARCRRHRCCCHRIDDFPLTEFFFLYLFNTRIFRHFSPKNSILSVHVSPGRTKKRFMAANVHRCSSLIYLIYSLIHYINESTTFQSK